MPKKIVLRVDNIRVTAELRDTPTAEAICGALPLEGRTQRWGGELYFPVSVNAPLEADSRETLLPGELGYWPEGNMFCIFFGTTPASQGDEIRPASAVNVFGRLIGRWAELRQVPADKTIRVMFPSDELAADAITEPVVPQTAKPSGSLFSPAISPMEMSPEPAIVAPMEPLVETTRDEIETQPKSLAEESAPNESTPLENQMTQNDSESEPMVESTDLSQTMEPAVTKSKTLFSLTDRSRIMRIAIAAGVLLLFLLAAVIGRSGAGSVSKQVDEQKKAIDSLVSQVSKLEADLKTAADTNRTIQNQLAPISQKFPSVESNVKTIQQQIANLNNQFANNQKGLSEWIRNPTNNHSYCISPMALPWHQAQALAKKMGGYLATLTDARENEWVVTQFGEQTEFWIGLNDEQEENKWVWSTGEKFEYANWAPGEPDNYRKNQHYVVINSIVPDRGSLEPGRWKDVSCNEIHLAIIERNQ